MPSAAITTDYLASRTWRFCRSRGANATDGLRFLPDGKIHGYTNPNERGWRLEDGVLALLGERGQVTTRFDHLAREGNKVTLFGQHLPNPSITLYLVEQTSHTVRLPGTRAHFGDMITGHGWEIGDHTYGIPGVIEEVLGKLRIGKYTSIAAGVKICFADHRTDTVSTYPFTVLNSYFPAAPLTTSSHISKGDVVIGNDVWIGTDAFISHGVTIGDGAVIGARSIVTRNVPPYAVVVGTPAHVVRHRFPDATIAALLSLAWWNWPDETVNAYLPLMTTGDVDGFIAQARRDPTLQSFRRSNDNAHLEVPERKARGFAPGPH